MDYDFELERIAEEIKKKKVKKVLIQLPEGIKKDVFKILEPFKGKVEILVSGGSCWGGCDLAIEEARKLNCGLLIHFGHAPFIKVDFPILYIEMRAKKKLVPILKKEINKLKIKKVGLVGSVQYVHQFSKVKDYLESEGKRIIIPKKKGFAAYDGHVIGCEFNSCKSIRKEVEGYLVLGNKFHALGVALTVVDKPVFLLDEHTNTLELMDKERERILKQRAIAIDKVRKSSKLGILVDLKPGQYHLGLAEKLREDLEKIGKQVIILVVREFNPDNMMNFYDVGAFIDTACPRIAIEDRGRYDKPMITVKEAQILLGNQTWRGLLKEGLIGFI